MKERHELIRISCENGQYVFGDTGKRQGRGAYICKNEECLEKARKHKGLERSFKDAVPGDVYDSLKRAIQN
jgi:predicted RNA-binding protein YlxR (DUF448 family)